MENDGNDPNTNNFLEKQDHFAFLRFPRPHLHTCMYRENDGDLWKMIPTQVISF